MVFANARGGYTYDIFAADLPARQHVLTLALPPLEESGLPRNANGPIKLGYALVAGESASSNEPSPQGAWPADSLSELRFHRLPSERFSWTSASANGVDPEKLVQDTPWRELPQDKNPWLDLSKIGENDSSAGVWLKTTINSEKTRQALLGLAVDYYARVWLNGEPAGILDGPHGDPKTPALLPVTLKAGKNEVLLKITPGSRGFGCCCFMEAEPETP